MDHTPDSHQDKSQLIRLDNHHHKLLILQVLLHVTAIAGLIFFWDPWWLLAALAGKFVFNNLGAEIGYHRLIAHRSFHTNPWIEYLLLLLGTFSAQGSAMGWAANHRVHHRNSDRSGDPHPASQAWRTWFWVGTNGHATVNPTVIRDLMRRPVYVWQRNWYFTLVYGVYLVAALIDPKLLIYFFAIPGAMAMTSGGMLNVVCHRWGYRNFDTPDNSRNNFWVNLYSNFSGLGLHNNHHQHPDRWDNRVRPGEIDLSAGIIKLLITKS